MAEWVGSDEWPNVESEQRFIEDVLLSEDLPSTDYKFWSNAYPRGTGREGREKELDIVMLGPGHVWVVSIKSSDYPVDLGKNKYLINGHSPRDRQNPWIEADTRAKKMRSYIDKCNQRGMYRELEDIYFQAMVAYDTPSLKTDGSYELCSFDQFIPHLRELETLELEGRAQRRRRRRDPSTQVQAMSDAFRLFDRRDEGRNYQGERFRHYSWQEEGDELQPPAKLRREVGGSKVELELLRKYTEASHAYDDSPYTVVVTEPRSQVRSRRQSEEFRELLNERLRDGERANFRLEESGLRRQAPWLLAPCDFGQREVAAGFVEIWESTKFALYKDKSNLSLDQALSQNRLTQELEKHALLSELSEILRSLLNANCSHGDLDSTRVLIDGEGTVYITVYITEFGDMYQRTPSALRGLKESGGAADRDCVFLGELMGELWGEMPVELEAAHELLLSGDLRGLDLLTDSLAGPPETEPDGPPTKPQPEPLGFEEWRGRLRACIAVVEFGGSIARSEMVLELERQSIGGSDEVIEALLVDGFLEQLPDECLTIAAPGIEFLRAEHARRRSSATPSRG